MTEATRGGFVGWTNTEGTYLDHRHSNKFISFNHVEYVAQCLNYRGEIRPKDADYVYAEVRRRIDLDRADIEAAMNALWPSMFGDWAKDIPDEKPNETDPYWRNGFFSFGDARAAYAAVPVFKPALIVEVGSGNSTKFFRKAIRDHAAATRIVSIDPHPRADIASLIDEFVPSSVLDVDPAVFDRLQPNDILFWDGSHICFNGSDVATLFLDVLPRLRPGVLVHVHDVSLPYAGVRMFRDLEGDISTHSHSESLMLATYLLNARGARIILPVHDLHMRKRLPLPGGSFWFIHG